VNDLAKGKPQFTTSIRGYDRYQVDDYIERLHDLVSDAEQRARIAESELEFREAQSELDLSRHASLGPRVSEILDLAVAESKELRERVKQKGDKLFARARREAEDIVESAHTQATAIREQAQRERQDALAKVDTERARAREDVIELEHRQSELLANLRQLQQFVSAAVNLAPAHLEPPTEELKRVGLDVATGGPPGGAAAASPFRSDAEQLHRSA